MFKYLPIQLTKFFGGRKLSKLFNIQNTKMDPLSVSYDNSNDNKNSWTSSSSVLKNVADQDSSSFPINSSISSNLKMPKAKRTKQIRFCIVCGQHSLYQYYGVQSCEGRLPLRLWFISCVSFKHSNGFSSVV